MKKNWININGIRLGKTELKILNIVDDFNEIQVWKVAELLSSSLYYQNVIYQIFYNLRKKGLVELSKTGRKNGLIASLTPLGKNTLINTILKHEDFYHSSVVEE
jgi:DNA-binding PadR family transcriptional regulator